ncbi:MAG: dihydrolipoyl dehydrogenase [Candidatus Krumholzibacteriales bacterium]
MPGYDLIVLGGGPAGYPAAIRASQLGARVCLIEAEKLGGVCLNWGCIPTKTMHAAAHLMEAGRSLDFADLSDVDMKSLSEHRAKVVDRLVSGVRKLLKKRGVEVISGRGRIISPSEVKIDSGDTVKGDKIIIATGSSAMNLPGMEFDGKLILSSKDLLNLDYLPSSLLIIGGGVIGSEFASIFNALGTGVTVVEMLPSLVSGESDRVSKYLRMFFRKKGIEVHLGSRVEKIEKSGDGITAHLEDGTVIESSAAVLSVGRVPNIEDIGLREVGIETKDSAIRVNGRMETNVKGVYAAGDVVGGYLLAHAATREGLVAAENAMGVDREIDYSLVPSTVYTIPEIAHVGLNMEEAESKGLKCASGQFPFSANGKALGMDEPDGFAGWVAEEESGKLLGLHIIGPDATELVSIGTVAVSNGMTAEEFEALIFPHPTLGEAIFEAAEDINSKSVHLL